MRPHSIFIRRLALAALLLPLLASAPVRKAKPAPKKAPVAATSNSTDMVVPDLTRYFGTWLWVKSDGLVSVSTPETRGAERTLILNPDLSYELHQRRDARDSLLCRGTWLFSEETSGGATVRYVDFGGWFEKYEHHMSVEFDGADTLLLAGDPCENCPEHTYVRGRTATFEDSVRAGQTYRRALWGGLVFELEPSELGWRIAVRDTTRPAEDLASLTPPFHFAPNPRDIEGWTFRNKQNTGPNLGDVDAPGEAREFIFSPEVGRSIPSPDSVGTSGMTVEMLDRVGARGRGVLEVERPILTPPAQGERAGILSMRFRVAIQEAR